MYIVTTPQMQAAERAADAAGHSYEQMMEQAGRSVAQAIEAHFDIVGARALILVGPGNNGGDGLVAARYLAQMGMAVLVYVWKRTVDGDRNWTRLDNTGVQRLFAEEAGSSATLATWLNEADVIVDALLGTGASRPIEGSLAELLDDVKSAVNLRRAMPDNLALTDPTLPYFDEEVSPVVIAVDLPSGLNSDTGAIDPHTLPADLSVTFAAPKLGHILPPGPAVVGRLIVGEIGITAEHYPAALALEMATAAKVARLLPARPVTAHKGTFGTALLVAGSMNYTGAALLAGQAAVRAGAGLVTLAVPEPIYPMVAGSLAEATYVPLPQHEGHLAPELTQSLYENLQRATALLVGPGLSHNPSTTTFLKNLLAKPDWLPPLVLDADALNILAQQPNWWQLLPPGTIITPHPGEMARLANRTTAQVQDNRLALAQQLAIQWQQVVLLKGAYTIIAGPDGRSMVLPFANPALAKAGSGDVLAGAIVSLRAQGLAAFEAAVAGGYVHGLAGELVREQMGCAGAAAGDLVRLLPAALRELNGESKTAGRRPPTVLD